MLLQKVSKACFFIYIIFNYCNVIIFILTDPNDESTEIVNPLEDDFEDQLREENENFSISPKRKNCDFLGTDKQGRHIFGIYASRFPEKSQMESFIR